MVGVDGVDEINLDQEIARLIDEIDKNCTDNLLQKHLADLYWKTTNFGKMIAGWSGLITRHPDEWKLHNQLATVFRRMADAAGENRSKKTEHCDIEIDTWKRLVIDHPEIWGLQLQLGKAYTKKGNIEEEIDGWMNL